MNPDPLASLDGGLTGRPVRLLGTHRGALMRPVVIPKSTKRFGGRSLFCSTSQAQGTLPSKMLWTGMGPPEPGTLCVRTLGARAASDSACSCIRFRRRMTRKPHPASALTQNESASRMLDGPTAVCAGACGRHMSQLSARGTSYKIGASAGAWACA